MFASWICKPRTHLQGTSIRLVLDSSQKKRGMMVEKLRENIVTTGTCLLF